MASPSAVRRQPRIEGGDVPAWCAATGRQRGHALALEAQTGAGVVRRGGRVERRLGREQEHRQEQQHHDQDRAQPLRVEAAG